MRTQRTTGFTLLELIVTMVLMGIIGGVFVNSLVYGIEQYEASRRIAGITQKARTALTRMHMELAEMKSLDSAHTGDIDGSGFYFVDHNGNAASFVLSSGRVLMNGSHPLVDDLGTYPSGQALFTYEDENGNAWQPSDGFDDLREVNITLLMDTITGQPKQFTHSVNPRKTTVPNAPRME